MPEEAPLRTWDRLRYTPVPGMSRALALLVCVFAVLPLVTGVLERVWGLVVGGVVGLGLATLLWMQARWNDRHPEMHTLVRAKQLTQQAKHPVRQVVVTAVALGLALPFFVSARVWGLDASPSVPVLVVAGLVGAAGGAGIGAAGVRHSRRLVGRTGDDPLPESPDEARGATTAMVALALGVTAVIQVAPVAGGVIALLLARRAKRLSARASTRQMATAAVACAWVGIVLSGALLSLFLLTG